MHVKNDNDIKVRNEIIASIILTEGITTLFLNMYKLKCPWSQQRMERTVLHFVMISILPTTWITFTELHTQPLSQRNTN